MRKKIYTYHAEVTSSFSDLKLLQVLVTSRSDVVPAILPRSIAGSKPTALAYELLLFSTRKQAVPITCQRNIKITERVSEVLFSNQDPYEKSLTNWSLDDFRMHLETNGLLGGPVEHQRRQATFLMSYWWLTLREVSAEQYREVQSLIREVTLIWGHAVYEFEDAMYWTEMVLRQIDASSYAFNECTQTLAHPDLKGYIDFLAVASNNPRRMLKHLAENAFTPPQPSKLFKGIIFVGSDPASSSEKPHTSALGKTTLMYTVVDRVPGGCFLGGHELFNLPPKMATTKKNQAYLEKVTIEDNKWILILDDFSMGMFVGRPTKLATTKNLLGGDPPFRGMRTILTTNMQLKPTGKKANEEEDNADIFHQCVSRSHEKFDIRALFNRFIVYGMQFVGSDVLVSFQDWIKTDIAYRIAFANMLHRMYCAQFSRSNDIGFTPIVPELPTLRNFQPSGSAAYSLTPTENWYQNRQRPVQRSGPTIKPVESIDSPETPGPMPDLQSLDEHSSDDVDDQQFEDELLLQFNAVAHNFD
ncbi:hypothetical protein HDE_00448 [Halotydeus destructor]|nr:hypothetical protein HDE_00448 [Halotydeus destructor]